MEYKIVNNVLYNYVVLFILHVFSKLRVYNAFDAINGLEFSVCIVIDVFVLVEANVLAHYW